MVKFKLPVEDTFVTSLRVPQGMLTQVHTSMEEGGYNKKQRKLWIKEAVDLLLSDSNRCNLIAEAFDLDGPTKSIPIEVSRRVSDGIDEVIKEVERSEGVVSNRSSLVRTAILNRLLVDSGLQFVKHK